MGGKVGDDDGDGVGVGGGDDFDDFYFILI